MPLLLTVALHAEARPLISHYNLKQDTASHAVPIFFRDDMFLAVSGVGRIKAAIATTYLLSKQSAFDDVFLINIGIAGHTQKPDDGPTALGDLFLVNKITEHATGRTFYPDMLVQTGLAEAALTTLDKPLDRSDGVEVEDGLVDMEAAGCWQAAAAFLSPHQIHCMKVVSDFLEIKRIDKAWINEIIALRLADVDRIFDACRTVTAAATDVLTEADRTLLDQLCRCLRLTASQHKILTDAARACKLHTNRALPDLSAFTQTTVHTRQEGKEHLEQIRRRLMAE